MGFILSNVFKSIARNAKINSIIVGTLFVAYLFFFLGCCYIEDGIRDMDSFRQKRMERSVHFESVVDHMDTGRKKPSEEEFGAFFAGYGFVENATVIEKNYLNDSLTGTSFSYFLIDPDYDAFFTIDILEGRYFTGEEMEEGAKVCVVEKAYKDIKNAEVGDVVTIDDVELQIIGVVKRNANAGVVFIPRHALDAGMMRDNHFQGYIVAATLSDPARASEIEWEGLGLSGRLSTAQAFYEEGVRFFLTRSIAVFIGCFVLLFYALLNLVNIMAGKLEAQKRSLGIRMALGASNWQVFLQFFFECLVLVLVAVGVIFLLEPLINLLVKSVFNHTFGWYSVVAMLFASVVSSFFIGRILLRKLKKMDVIGVIKNL